jgi:hypothetical protein
MKDDVEDGASTLCENFGYEIFQISDHEIQTLASRHREVSWEGRKSVRSINGTLQVAQS